MSSSEQPKKNLHGGKGIWGSCLSLVLIVCLTLLKAKVGPKPAPQTAATDAAPYVSQVWVSDNGDGTYTNPVLCADYSDPDVCRRGNDFYMTASSFNCVPGLPILHSNDLVNWTIVSHALRRQPPEDVFSTVQHGNGVWAPCIRYHDGFFYIFYGDPDYGIYMVRTADPAGTWEQPVLVKAGKGLIDPTVLWDDDGTVYLVHAYAGSRAGIKSILTACKLTADATSVLGDEILIFDGHAGHPTIEGPKIYKHEGYYYILAPAGGVTNGWQLALRSKQIYGPYEERIVLAQGRTQINGPHQGGWVTTPTGESWFLHFQDAGAYGRVVHLQPITWKDGWPVMGNDPDGDGTGEPVLTFRKPDVGRTYPIATPAESDEFDTPTLGLQWQWQANPVQSWGFAMPSRSVFRLFSVQKADPTQNYRQVPNLLLQKFPAYTFTATAKITFQPYHIGEKAGLIIMGDSYAYIAVTLTDEGLTVMQAHCQQAIRGGREVAAEPTHVTGKEFYLRVHVGPGARCTFSYSTDGQTFSTMGDVFTATEGRWIGAKVGLFCSRDNETNNAGYADIDWFHITDAS